jgi:hypothetical protein
LIVALNSGCISTKKVPAKMLAKAKLMQPFDAIIVPGIPFKNGSWDNIMKARVLWSYILYKNGIAKNVIFSGGAVYTNYCESKIMALYALQLGVPQEHIFVEKIARHSTENVYYSYLLARDAGFTSIALATDPFQSATLRSLTRKRFCTPIYHLPFIKDSLLAYNQLAPLIDPSEAIDNNFSDITNEPFIRRLRGTMGRDINWKQYPKRKVPALTK